METSPLPPHFVIWPLIGYGLDPSDIQHGVDWSTRAGIQFVVIVALSFTMV